VSRAPLPIEVPPGVRIVCESVTGVLVPLTIRGGMLCGAWGPVSKDAKVVVLAPRRQLDQAYEVSNALWRQHKIEAETRTEPEAT